MTDSAAATLDSTPDFCKGMLHFGTPPAEFASLCAEPVIAEGRSQIDRIDSAAVFQTQLAADALRYLTLQLCASKESGHPGGFASAADAYAALAMLGHTNIVTEVGHHAPGFYSAMFLDGSLEAMGIHTLSDLQTRFRERGGLLGHLSGAIPGLLAPAGPLGQGQHFAMAGAYLNRDTLFPCTIGDGGLGEPYILSAMKHFHTAYPEVTNFLPVLIWNGFSQEHHSMVSLMDNAAMMAYWTAHDFARVILIDAKTYDDAGQEGAYVDSTRFGPEARLAFSRAILEGMQEAADSALSGTLTAVIVKQLKGAGVHTVGAKSHNLYPGDTPEKPNIAAALERRALAPEIWQLVRTNLSRAGGGPAGKTVVTEFERPLADIGTLPMQAFAPGEQAVPASAMAQDGGRAGSARSRVRGDQRRRQRGVEHEGHQRCAQDPPSDRGSALQPDADRSGLRAAERGRLRRFRRRRWRCSAGARCGCPTRASPSTAGRSCRPWVRRWPSCATAPRRW